jgi:hypothetical protein
MLRTDTPHFGEWSVVNGKFQSRVDLRKYLLDDLTERLEVLRTQEIGEVHKDVNRRPHRPNSVDAL